MGLGVFFVLVGAALIVLAPDPLGLAGYPAAFGGVVWFLAHLPFRRRRDTDRLGRVDVDPRDPRYWKD